GDDPGPGRGTAAAGGPGRDLRRVRRDADRVQQARRLPRDLGLVRRRHGVPERLGFRARCDRRPGVPLAGEAGQDGPLRTRRVAGRPCHGCAVAPLRRARAPLPRRRIPAGDPGRPAGARGVVSTHADVVQIDLELVEELTKREVAALDDKHIRSLAYREEAKTHLPGGVSSSWQTWPPHPIYVSRGRGSRVWDIDGNEYVDYHNGYRVTVIGHAHPKIVEAVQRRVELGTHFAQPTEDALVVAEELEARSRLPYWRFGNSGTESTLDAVRIMRALTGRNLIMKIEGSYHGHHDSLMVSFFPPRETAGPRDHPVPVPQTLG